MQTFVKKYSKITLLFSFLAAILVLIPSLALADVAAADKEIQTGIDTVKTFTTGKGGNFAAIVALAIGIVGCVLRFNIIAILSSFGVAILCKMGPGIISALF